jgi:hypothetical protein
VHNRLEQRQDGERVFSTLLPSPFLLPHVCFSFLVILKFMSESRSRSIMRVAQRGSYSTREGLMACLDTSFVICWITSILHRTAVAPYNILYPLSTFYFIFPSSDRSGKEGAKSLRLQASYIPLHEALQRSWRHFSKRQTKDTNPSVVFGLFGKRHNQIWIIIFSFWRTLNERILILISISPSFVGVRVSTSWSSTRQGRPEGRA